MPIKKKDFNKRLAELSEWAKTADWCDLALMTMELEIEKDSLKEYLTPAQISEYDQLLYLFETHKAQMLTEAVYTKSYNDKVSEQLGDLTPVDSTDPMDDGY